MIGRPIQLFRIFGFAIKIDPSWFVIVVLITWSLAKGLFPSYFKDLSPPVYWSMGIAGAMGLFVSIIFHELAHSIVARRFGIQIKGITLFIFGGVAEMADEPPSPGVEFAVAIAGPVASVLLAGSFFMVYLLPWPTPVHGVLGYLAMINAVLAVFNLVPAFPLDGGRIMRAMLWQIKGNLKWATRLTSQIGTGFGLFLIFLGAFSVVAGNFIAGMWWFLLGLFLRHAARVSYQQLLMRQGLEGEPISRFMQTDVRTVPPHLTVRQLVEDYIYRYHYKMFPVVENGSLLGCVTFGRIKDVPSDRWDSDTIAQIAVPCTEDNTIGPDADALSALAKMNRAGLSRLMVVQGDRLLGIVSLKDMLKFIALKVELEDGSPSQ